MKKKLYENRELSWLKFNERVLKEAKNSEVPLGERLSFVSIYQSNLDEFFMVRVGCLHDQINLFDDYKDDKSNMTSHQQIEAICKEVRNLNKKKEKIYSKLMNTLCEYKVSIANLSNITAKEEKVYSDIFKKQIQPFLSPIVVGKQQVFPFLKNRDVYAISVLKSKSNKIKIGVVACRGEDFPNIIEIPGKDGAFVLTEDLILHYMSSLFPNHIVAESSLIRITRSADIGMERFYDEDLDYRAEMENIIKMRRKLCPVRIEMTEKLNKETMDKICQFLVLERGRVFFNNTPLDFGFLSEVRKYLKRYPELFYKTRIPADNKTDIIDRVLKNEDVLLSYPFESMQPFLDMLKKAAENKNTESIKITLYRVAKQSTVVQHLIDAAKKGIKVDVLVELKARFDEENNIEWSKQLEKAGCNVIYGWSGLKVHSKLCLITFKDGENKSYITQIGTGNYNENTAKLYTDLALITADTRIAEEAKKVFEALFSDKLINTTEHLLVAPNCMKDKILALIDEEIQHAKAGEEAYIGAKMNSLTDVKIINKLVKASESGVKIDLIIRGICCIQPGINGYTDNINVISIVGQYLEHSRIYMFGSPERRKMYISSADWMTRNMSRRVEVAAPIYSDKIRKRIQIMFDVMLADTAKARKKHSDGTYKRIHKDYHLNSQEYFADNKGLSDNESLKKAENFLISLKNNDSASNQK